MVSKAKLYTKLDALEAELRERLVPHLEKAAMGDNDLVFCVEDFNPFPELKHKTDGTTEELVSIGASILALKKKLGEPSDGSIAERICWYCRAWAATGKDHKKSAAGLAAEFLEEVGSN